MARTPSCDKNGFRKGTWTAEEDRKLIAYVTRYGCWNWRQLPKFAGLARCGKSCRLRWMNYLRPNLKRGNFTPQEEEIIIRMHQNLGNRWSIIAAELPGRTDNEVKNHWHTTLKRRVQQNTVTNEEVRASIESTTTPRRDMPNNGFADFQVTPPASSQISDTTGPLSPLSYSSEFSSITSDYSTAASNDKLVIEDDFSFLDDLTEHMNESFWIDQPYVDEFSYTPTRGNINTDCARLQNEDATTTTTKMIHDAARVVSPDHSSNESSFVMDNDLSSFLLDAYTEPTVDSFWTHPYVADMSHVPTEILTPLVGESDYFTTVYDADLWSL